MEKHELRKAIQAELALIGIFMVLDQESDLSLDIVFEDAKNNNPVHFKNKILLNEETQTLNYWEKVSDSKIGFFSDNDTNTTTQIGTTLYRKVVNRYTDSNGRQVVENIDIGEIGKRIKQCAKEAGWKTKIVLSEKKASFAEDYIPTQSYSHENISNDNSKNLKIEYCTKCGQPFINDSKFCGNCGHPRHDSTIESNNEFINHPKKNLKVKGVKPKFGLFKIILTVIMVPVIGFAGLVAWELIKGGSQPEQPQGTVTQESSNYVNMGYTIYVVPFHEQIDTNNPRLYDLKLWVLIYQDYLTVDDVSDPIESVEITDFYLNTLNKGEFEKFQDSLYIHSASGNYYEGTINEDSISIPLTGVLINNAGYMDTISFSFHIGDIGEYEYPSDYSGAYFEDIAFENAGISSDDIRFGFSYTIRLKTSSGKEFIHSMKIDPLEGELIYIESDDFVTSKIESDILEENLFQELK